jgi:protoheme IX farnesyltransferase
VKFLSLTKPGIILGNIITVLGGYLIGAQGHINIRLFTMTIVGMALVMASGCVLNNYLDQDIDRLMERTKNRVLVKGLISNRVAIQFAVLLGILGIAILYWQTNLLTVVIAAAGLFFYVVVYTLWFKRRSIYGTLIGGISGAIPPVVGYCAVTNQLNMGAVILFLILFLWQIPHFYAIAIYRQQDYIAASLPVLPIKKGIHCAKIHMLLYILAFTIVATMLTLLHYTGILYLFTVLVIGLVWFLFGLKGLISHQNDQIWSRKMFLFSIANITLLCMMMSVR